MPKQAYIVPHIGHEGLKTIGCWSRCAIPENPLVGHSRGLRVRLRREDDRPGGSDIDLMIVSDNLTTAAKSSRTQPVTRTVGHDIPVPDIKQRSFETGRT